MAEAIDSDLSRILDRFKKRLAPHKRRELEEMWKECPPEEWEEALDCLLECGSVLEWRAENRSYSIAAAGYLCPLLSARSPTVEARHARRKGARHRGDDLAAAQKKSALGWTPGRCVYPRSTFPPYTAPDSLRSSALCGWPGGLCG